MTIDIRIGDCRQVLAAMPSDSVHCVVTSPPYFGLRDYGVDGQIGLEASPDAFVAEMVAVFREVRRVLRDDGTLWLNLGDSYNSGGGYSPDAPSNRNSKQSTSGGSLARNMPRIEGLKHKDLIGIPWRVAFALQQDGWYFRQDIIWHKPNPMPESVTDRCTKSHEYVFLMSKSARYFYDQAAIREEAVCEKLPGRNMTDTRETYGAGNGGNSGLKALRNRLRDSGESDKDRNARSVWTIATQPFKEAHFATFPPDLAERCIKAGCPKGGTVLDPFGGAGTTGLVADRLGRNAILIELNPQYANMARNRIADDLPMFADIRTS